MLTAWMRLSSIEAKLAKLTAATPQAAVNSFETIRSRRGVDSRRRRRLKRSTVDVEPSAANSLEVELMAAQRITAIRSPSSPFGT